MPTYNTGNFYYAGTRLFIDGVEVTNATVQVYNNDTFWVPIETTTATTSINTNVWHQWVVTTDTGSVTPNEVRIRHGMQPMEVTITNNVGGAWPAQQRDPREELIRRNRIRAAQMRSRIKRRAADRVALDLLMSLLTPEQRDEYERLKRFHVVGNDGKVYRLRRGWAGNLDVVENAQSEDVIERWCVHPRSSVPAEDNLLAQKLMLETDAGELRRIANVTPIRPRRAA